MKTQRRLEISGSRSAKATAAVLPRSLMQPIGGPRAALLLAMAFAVMSIVPGALVHGQSGAVIGNLRVASDETGTPMETIPAGPGEKVYALEAGTSRVLLAFDFNGTSPTTVQLRLMAPQGTILLQEEREISEVGTHVIEYDGEDLPLQETEYVANVYVQTDGNAFYLADSLQMTVGNASISPAVNELGGQAQVEGVQPSIGAGGQPEISAGGGAAAEAPVVPGPSPMLLVLAGLGVVSLLGVVAWAGVSAMRQTS